MALNGRPTPPDDWLMLYNTDNASSLSDAQWYAGQRGLKADYMGFNFGAGYPNLLVADCNSGPIVCQTGSTQFRGATDNTWAGLNLVPAVQGYFSKYKNGGILAATFTPNGVNDGTGYAPLCAYAATRAINIDLQTSLAHGRMGFIGDVTKSVEYVSKAGGSLFRTAVANALAAEAVSHLDHAHWGSNSSACTYPPYIQQSDVTGLLTWMQSQGFPSVNLGVDYPFNSGLGNDWLTGTVVGAPNLFAFVEAGAAFNTYSGYNGAAPYTANYTALQGAWGFTWASSAFQFLADLFWNGGVGGVACIAEPFAGGLRNPIYLLQSLVAQRLTLAEAVQTTTFYGQAVNTESGVGYVAAPCYYTTAFGDPLYKPYKSTPAPAQLPFFGALPGSIRVT